ncbi:ImuA family protein [Devosia sp. CAU 1758]
MQTQNHQQRLAALRDVIAEIERKPALAEMQARSFNVEEGAFPRLPGGLLQEVFTDAVRNGGASLGFALAQAKTLLSHRRMAVLYLQLATDAQFFGLPYGPGLSSFGLDPARLVIVRAADMRDLLWVAEESLACQAVAGIIADIGGDPEPLDFTVSRRLSMRAVESGTSLFLLRYGQKREASAAHLRWHLLPQRSGRRLFDERAPGMARWGVKLEKGNAGQRNVEWILEWTENGFKALPNGSGHTRQPHPGTSVPMPVPALLADRISQTA